MGVGVAPRSGALAAAAPFARPDSAPVQSHHIHPQLFPEPVVLRRASTACASGAADPYSRVPPLPVRGSAATRWSTVAVDAYVVAGSLKGLGPANVAPCADGINHYLRRAVPQCQCPRCRTGYPIPLRLSRTRRSCPSRQCIRLIRPLAASLRILLAWTPTTSSSSRPTSALSCRTAILEPLLRATKHPRTLSIPSCP